MLEIIGIVLGIIVIVLGIMLFLFLLKTVIAISALIGALIAVRNYFLSASSNMIFRTWSWERGNEPAKRSYFFGPGYVQLINTIRQSLRTNVESAGWFGEVTENLKTGFDPDEILNTLLTILAYAFHFAGVVSVIVFGTVFTLMIAGIHALFTALVMICIYVIYSVVWLVDRGYLIARKINPLCPNCKNNTFTVPSYVCPGCSAIHRQLVPGPYGIFHHTCICGMQLPAIFMNGRSALESHCPVCNTKLASSDTTPFVIQMAGGTGAGKTVYAAAFFHWLIQSLNQNAGVSWEIPEDFAPFFEKLEQYYNGAVSDTSTYRNSQLFPVIITPNQKTKYMFSVFDIAGEMFDESASEKVIQQKQFQYCNGFFLILDPFCQGSSLEFPDDGEGDVYSEMDFEEVVTTFINYLLEITQIKIGTSVETPLSVIIAKCDVDQISQRMSEDAVNTLMKSPGNEWMTLDNARDHICRQFIEEIGFLKEIELLEETFSFVHYFPVSAMGHQQNGTPYDPSGVAEPLRWIMEKENHDLLALFE